MICSHYSSRDDPRPEKLLYTNKVFQERGVCMKHKINKVLSILLALALVLGLAPAVSIPARAAEAQDPIKYLDETGAEKECTNYTVIDGSTKAMTYGWYVLSSSVEISDRITVTGNVCLILCDGCTLTAKAGVRVDGENSLTIYGQSEGDMVGTLNATAVNGDAAIGGNNGGSSGEITINGGTVTATASGSGAAIGNGAGGAGGTLSLYADAKVTAGESEDSATPVPAADRADSCTSRYVCIEPCDHSEYTESACKWCGTPRKYSVTFVDEDGTVLKAATEYDYGTPAASIEKPADPTKPADAQYTYAFDKWSPDIAEVTGDATYTATYKRTAIRQTYTLTYVVNVAETEHGTLAVSPTNARPGAEVTVTPQPEEGYEVDTVKVTDKDGKEISVTKNEDGTYSFTMPSGKLTVAGTFKEKAHDCPSAKFTDVKESDWFHEYVDYVVSKGLMNGVSADKFGPGMTTTRAMIVTILYRLEGQPAVTGANPFDDVKDGQWYTNAVIWANQNGIVKGYGDGVFGPTDEITREQFASILYRYVQMKGGGFTGAWYFPLDFADAADVSDWADEAMHWCVMNGIFEGDENGKLRPQGEATRAEVAAILMRFIENVK